MTDRPAGTPDPDATDPDVDALEGAEADAIEAAAPADEVVEPDGADLVDAEAEPEPDDVDGEPDAEDEVAPVDEDEESDDEADGEPDDYDAAVREVAGEDVAPAAAAAAAGAAATPTKKRGAQPAPTHVPTPSEKAVHVREDVSKVFVIAAVAVFVAILLNGLLFGTGGLFTPIATPSPSPSAAPSASASAGPSASASASAPASASPSPSASASAPASTAPSASASARRRPPPRPRPHPARRSQPGLSCPHGDRGGRHRHHGPPTGDGWSTSSSGPAASATNACSRR